MGETTGRPTRDPPAALAAAPDFEAAFHASPSPMLLLAADAPRFTMVAVNRAHAAAFRTRREALEGYGLFEVFPDPLPAEAAGFVDTIRASINRVMEAGKPDEMPVQPYAVIGADGQPEERFWGATQTPVFDAAGRLTHILSTVRDVTAEVTERRINEARALLMREVDHRARNALTVVQSIVRLTEAETQEAFKAVVQGRVEALARAQTSLARRKWEGAYLQDVVEAELAALAPREAYAVEGPQVLVRAEQVQAISMIVHELATNARKYGALSAPEGRVEVSWTAEGERLTLGWREAGGPRVTAPRRSGFGSKLIGRLARQLCAEIAYDWRAEGLWMRLTGPLRM